VTKITSLMLFDGYAETSTHGCVLLAHLPGFDSLQEALMDLHRLASAKTEADFKEYGKLLKVKRGETVTEFIRGMIRGDFQSNDAWEAFAERGRWGMAAHLYNFDWKNRVDIANAPELIGSAPYWLERDPARWPTDDPDVSYCEQSDTDYECGLSVLTSYISFANPKMRTKMFIGGRLPKTENE